MRPADLLSLLQSCHRDKLALYRGHEAGALRVSGYEFNNTYQYVLAREQTHLSWIRSAIERFGAEPDEAAVSPAADVAAKGTDAVHAIVQGDARRAAEFLAVWRPRVAAMSQARHRKMLELVLGEVAEHQRFFEQAAAGRVDLLGRRPASVGTGGGVMATRWIE